MSPALSIGRYALVKKALVGSGMSRLVRSGSAQAVNRGIALPATDDGGGGNGQADDPSAPIATTGPLVPSDRCAWPISVYDGSKAWNTIQSTTTASTRV